jgi:cysteine desulfurase
MKNMKRIFLDYASTTPLDPKVEKAMKPYFSKNFGNPSAIYAEGLVGKKVVKESREKIARLLNIRSRRNYFYGQWHRVGQSGNSRFVQSFQKTI